MPSNNNINSAANNVTNHNSPAERFRRNLNLNYPSSQEIMNSQSTGHGNTLITNDYNSIENNVVSPYRKLI